MAEEETFGIGKESSIRGLSLLDPHRNHYHHLHHHQQQPPPHHHHQSQFHNLEEENNTEQSEKEATREHHHHHHQYLQQLHQTNLQQQLLFERLDTPPPPPPPQASKKRSYFRSSSPAEQSIEHARLRERMGETHHQATPSRLGLRHAGGEIVEVQGGHIVRSTGRKDRHSKVCTAKGPRDRRVRLSAHTAIQFYDVQDRLGYDRPSKAVDWLIKNAKAAIDELEKLPAWNPTSNANNFDQKLQEQEHEQELTSIHHGGGTVVDALGGSCSRIDQQQHMQMGNNNNNSSFLPPSLDSDSIADTIKSFFPMGAAAVAEANSSAMQFQSFPPPDLLSRTSSQSQDLRLSLQSFQDPILLHQQQQQHHQQSQHQTEQEQAIFSGTTSLGFDANSGGWSEHQPQEISRFQRMFAWNAGGDTTGTGGGGGFIFNSPPTPQLLQPLFSQNQFLSQRGPLQSSNTQSVRAWIDPSSISAADHHHRYQSLPIHPSSFPGIGFTSVGGFSGFRIPARIQGEDEEHDGISDKPSSASSDSYH
ncbi:hypothetical protein TEA_018953 [Camellia sinensis var. sinensis]|uniref:TCP domain-containing protein n=2 Tax=Camellia sinensis TaxID=4442 RepID=A0A4S4EG61_CAMSN|nr:hypothetical protein TEA_018953 [Camellia sinensis var. sinensis]